MVLWFVGGTLVIAWSIFHDPRLDYRVLVAGVLLPDVVDSLFGGARAFHSVTASVVLLLGVMLATIGHRAARRRWLLLPIGTFLHLILDGVFTRTKVFWWPFTGWSFTEAQLPSIERGAWNVLLEAAGLAALVWFWHRFGLADPSRRRLLVRTGQLDPEIAERA